MTIVLVFIKKKKLKKILSKKLMKNTRLIETKMRYRRGNDGRTKKPVTIIVFFTS